MNEKSQAKVLIIREKGKTALVGMVWSQAGEWELMSLGVCGIQYLPFFQVHRDLESNFTVHHQTAILSFIYICCGKYKI